MPPSIPLDKLAHKLATDGPVKVLPTPRMVKLLFNGCYILQTTQARYVWEHPYYPQFYVPKSELLANTHTTPLQVDEGETYRSADGKNTLLATQLLLTVHSRTTGEVLAFAADLTGPAAPLAGLVKIDFAAIDQWFEEDTPIHVHPKDPFKRIDILTSRRRLTVSIAGVTIADTGGPGGGGGAQHLYETGLPCRYYLPLTCVRPDVLRRSSTRTQCPYKGEAEYYSVEVNGEVHEDVVWFYNRPTLECGLIVGLVCCEFIYPLPICACCVR